LKILDRDADPWVAFQSCLSGCAEPAVAIRADVLDGELAAYGLRDHMRIGQTPVLRLQADDAALVFPGKQHRLNLAGRNLDYGFLVGLATDAEICAGYHPPVPLCNILCELVDDFAESPAGVFVTLVACSELPDHCHRARQ
jgi:hypothetical protein